MNFVQKVANNVMAPPAFRNKAAFAVWAVSAITITRLASSALADLGEWVVSELTYRDQYGRINIPYKASDDKVSFIRFVDRTSKRVEYYLPKLVYAVLGLRGLVAAKSNDTALMAALAVVAFGYFSSPNDVLAIARGKLAVTFGGDVRM